jgi:hypothetical protein
MDALSGAVDVPAGRRRAALTLHALAAPDRDWLLAQLPADDRAALERLLGELSELGIPAESAVISAALADAPPAAALGAPHAQVLAREAETLRGPLLSLLAADQREAVLAHWPLALEARPAPAAPSAWTPRLQDALRQSWQALAAAQEPQP